MRRDWSSVPRRFERRRTCFRWFDLDGDGTSDPGEMNDLGVLPNHSYYGAFGVNDNGQIVGTTEGGDGVASGFVWNANTGFNYSLLLVGLSRVTVTRSTIRRTSRATQPPLTMRLFLMARPILISIPLAGVGASPTTSTPPVMPSDLPTSIIVVVVLPRMHSSGMERCRYRI